ncbi:FAD/FMN-containing dehydrogenase [Streptomyces sp. Amel2xB2]|uniref:FAD-binding oxidoreductase n=1 Tax=Streptomyces sp. Amel2xB2 TaxID=1305829 RepID=UPI000DBAC673|nr:FAD-binding oxidoreductase [Streptomyces sp. Amel2xB2]RAJ61831.1 FAD/FMN-containing dehydrogenase [Streptomyces sp. Amel2xB2]
MSPRNPRIAGGLLRRGEHGYEQARDEAVWNGLTPDRFPEAIVRAASAADVTAILAYARETGLRVSVRSGGHHWSGPTLRDGSLLLDLSRLRDCHVDPESATATVGPAVTGGTLAAALAPHGFSFPTGHCPEVALGGYLLAGGLGWNSRAVGPACRYIEEVEAVTADGRTVLCDASHNADLFWAARGAGPGFCAVATRFRLRLLPTPGAITTASFTFALDGLDADAVSDEAVRVGSRALRAARETPPNVETSLVLQAPDAAATSGTGGAGPRLRIDATAFADTPDGAARALDPLATCPFVDEALEAEEPHPTDVRTLYEGAGATGPSGPSGRRHAVDTLWSPDPYETQLARAARLIARAPSPDSYVLIPFEPVVRDENALRHMAFSALGASYLAAFAIWDDPAADEAGIRWLRAGMDALDPHGTGSHYVGEADLTAGPARSRRSYAPADWERLRHVRERWDPTDLFHGFPVP